MSQHDILVTVSHEYYIAGARSKFKSLTVQKHIES